MSNADHTYLQCCGEILLQGNEKEDRTGTGTLSLFGPQMHFNLRKEFPLLTTKRIPFRLIVSELLWMLRGSTNVRELQAENNHIWDEWADENGDLGPIYGKQWRSWEGAPLKDGDDWQSIDQIKEVIYQIKTNPDSRRMIVSAWNVADISSMKLPPCHALFQFYVFGGELSCKLYQRSADMFLGVPFNIASYALLTHMIANECGLTVGDFIWSGGDCHIYKNHLLQMLTQLRRDPIPVRPMLLLTSGKPVLEMTKEDICLESYYPHEPIKGEVAV